MKHHAVVQGSQEWTMLRLGVPTASCFDRIITPKKGELSTGYRKYAVELLTELIIGQPIDGPTTPSMLHGTDSEAKAVAAYELEMGVDTEPCGFCVTDDGRAGASPDRFVGEDGLLEVKCPFKPEIHVGSMLVPQSLVDEHWVQIQGQLLITGRKWVDLISYFVSLPMVRVRVLPDEAFQAKMATCLKLFCDELALRVDIAREKGWLREAEPAPQDPKGEGVTMDDLEFLVQAGAIKPLA